MFMSQVSKKPTLNTNKTKVFQVLINRKFTVYLPFSVSIHYSKLFDRRIAGKHFKQEKVGCVNPVGGSAPVYPFDLLKLLFLSELSERDSNE